jgi:hypothetical protein
MSAKRRWVIEEAEDPETGQALGHYDREQLLALMSELEAVLFNVGGMVAFTTERVQFDELGGEPLAVSRRVIVDWSAFAPMRREPVYPPPPSVADEPLVLAAEPDDDEEDEEEEVDRSLTTTGPPRADASL